MTVLIEELLMQCHCCLIMFKIFQYSIYNIFCLAFPPTFSKFVEMNVKKYENYSVVAGVISRVKYVVWFTSRPTVWAGNVILKMSLLVSACFQVGKFCVENTEQMKFKFELQF